MCAIILFLIASNAKRDPYERVMAYTIFDGLSLFLAYSMYYTNGNDTHKQYLFLISITLAIFMIDVIYKMVIVDEIKDLNHIVFRIVVIVTVICAFMTVWSSASYAVSMLAA
jgi:hypothetical protein